MWWAALQKRNTPANEPTSLVARWPFPEFPHVSVWLAFEARSIVSLVDEISSNIFWAELLVGSSLREASLVLKVLRSQRSWLPISRNQRTKGSEVHSVLPTKLAARRSRLCWLLLSNQSCFGLTLWVHFLRSKNDCRINCSTCNTFSYFRCWSNYCCLPLRKRRKSLKRISPTKLASCQPDQRPAHHMGPQVPRKLVLLVGQQPIKWARLLELHPFHGQQAAAKSGSLGAASAGGVNKVGFPSGLPLWNDSSKLF